MTAVALRDLFARSSFELSDDTTFEEWAAYGQEIAKAVKHALWILGDWWNFGERNFGERAAQVLDSDTYEYGTFTNAGWVARRFEPERRRADLTFTHHQAVAALEPRVADAILERAADEHWTTRETRLEVRKVQTTPETPARRVETAIHWAADSVINAEIMVPSESEPGRYHEVALRTATVNGEVSLTLICDDWCRGFAQAGYCRHVDAAAGFIAFTVNGTVKKTE